MYCAAAVWGLHQVRALCGGRGHHPPQAYRRLDDDRGKSCELGQAAVACMRCSHPLYLSLLRGVLHTWMRQSEDLEEWKVAVQCVTDSDSLTAPPPGRSKPLPCLAHGGVSPHRGESAQCPAVPPPPGAGTVTLPLDRRSVRCKYS